MAIKVIQHTDLTEVWAKRIVEQEEAQRVVDLELALADQVLANVELQARVTDTELALADILAGGVA